MLGPIDYIVLGFKGNNFDGSIMREISNATANYIIRVLDLVLIVKDDEGNVSEAEYEDQSTDIKHAFGDIEVDPNTPLLTSDDILKIGAELEPDTAAGVLVIEHLWARNLKRAIADAGGFVVDEGRIHPEKVEAAVAELEQLQTT